MNYFRDFAVKSPPIHEEAVLARWRPVSRRLGCALAALFVLFRLLAFLPSEVNSFAASHYLFSYTNGFHKRALPGAVLGHFFGYLTNAEIYAVSLGVLAVFAIGLLLFVRSALLASKESLVLAVALLGAPAVLPHFAYSIGYFDPILVICALLTTIALDAPVAEWLQVPLAFAPSALGVLTHESYVLAGFPLVLARAWLAGKPQRSAILTLTTMVFVLTIGVQVFGQPAAPVDLYLSQAASRTNVPLDREAFELLYFHLRENYSYLIRHYSSVLTDARLAAALIVPAPYFLMLHDLFRLAIHTTGRDAGARWMASLCTLAPLALIVVGFDALRWVSFVCLICSLLVLECIRLDPSGETHDAVIRYVRSARFGILVLFSFTLAPLHVVDGNSIATGIHSVARGLGLVRW